MSEFIQSRVLRWMLVGLGSFVLLIGAFSIGTEIGQRKERHLARWCQNYRGMSSHQIFGSILSLSDSGFIVQGKNNLEEQVLVSSSTLIRIGRQSGTRQDLQEGAPVAIFGAPNEQGQIHARLIRLFPPPMIFPSR